MKEEEEDNESWVEDDAEVEEEDHNGFNDDKAKAIPFFVCLFICKFGEEGDGEEGKKKFLWVNWRWRRRKEERKGSDWLVKSRGELSFF